MSRRNGDKELSQLQRYKYENDKLKRENAKLRKLIQRGRADQELLHELVLKENQEEAAAHAKEIEKNKWTCWDCGVGILIGKDMPRLDGLHYWRVCNNPDCSKHTKLKRKTDDVKGPWESDS